MSEIVKIIVELRKSDRSTWMITLTKIITQKTFGRNKKEKNHANYLKKKSFSRRNLSAPSCRHNYFKTFFFLTLNYFFFFHSLSMTNRRLFRRDTPSICEREVIHWARNSKNSAVFCLKLRRIFLNTVNKLVREWD